VTARQFPGAPHGMGAFDDFKIYDKVVPPGS
jgi:hypothetical protein